MARNSQQITCVYLHPNLSSAKVNISPCKSSQDNASRRKPTQVGGQTKRKLNASPKLASTCESVWPRVKRLASNFLYINVNFQMKSHHSPAMSIPFSIILANSTMDASRIIHHLLRMKQIVNWSLDSSLKEDQSQVNYECVFVVVHQHLDLVKELWEKVYGVYTGYPGLLAWDMHVSIIVCKANIILYIVNIFLTIHPQIIIVANYSYCFCTYQTSE